MAGLGPGPGGGAPGQIGAGLEQSPGYQFRLNEGMKALQRSAAARGTLLTGGTLKGLERYAQDYASNEYGTRVNQLAGLAGIGQTATDRTGDLLTGQGNAAAAGTVGSANAWQQGLQGATGAAGNIAQMYYLSRLFNPGASAAGMPTYQMYGPQSAAGVPVTART